MAIVHSNSRLIVIVLIGIVRVVVRIVVINTKNIENNKANIIINNAHLEVQIMQLQSVINVYTTIFREVISQVMG
jgi:hypothetical protein